MKYHPYKLLAPYLHLYNVTMQDVMPCMSISFNVLSIFCLSENMQERIVKEINKNQIKLQICTI